MSWYEDCPLERDDILHILAYLILLSQIQENLMPMINKKPLDELIQKLVSWLSNA